jgi:NADH:ubiquinone oxidoreductase subunit 2 (subunit N)
MWFRDPADGITSEPAPLAPGMTVALVFAAVGVVVLGVFPGPLLELAERSAASLLQIPAGLTQFGP